MARDRIDKILSHHGFGSRKDVKSLLRGEYVTVNGNFVYDPGFLLDIESDVVVVDGEEVRLQHDLYIMMNKCQDVVCANKDGEHRTVFDLLDENLRHKFLGGDLHCVGRLDIDTEGLLILTTDGKMTHKLLAPKTHVPKTYGVGLRDKYSAEEKTALTEKFAKGFFVEHEGRELGFDAEPAVLKFAGQNDEFSDDRIDCFLTITEGKFHQVKRMFSQVGNEVVYLKRISMGDLKLDSSIKLGEYRELTKDEVKLLKGD